MEHLGGFWRNRVFHALGISAPRRVAETKLAGGKSAAPTVALEKAKWKHGSASAVPAKP